MSSSDAKEVTIERISPGDGKNFPEAGDTVKIHYVGTFTDGTEFDSSRKRGKPFETVIGRGKVIKGWDIGVPQLSLGEKARLKVPFAHGYGDKGYPPVIPPRSDLIFEVELKEIIRA